MLSTIKGYYEMIVEKKWITREEYKKIKGIQEVYIWSAEKNDWKLRQVTII